MSWVGIYGNFSESLNQLCQFWQINISHEKRLNINKAQNKRTDINDPNVINAITKQNLYDLLLYDIAHILFRQQQLVLQQHKRLTNIQ